MELIIAAKPRPPNVLARGRLETLAGKAAVQLARSASHSAKVAYEPYTENNSAVLALPLGNFLVFDLETEGRSKPGNQAMMPQQVQQGRDFLGGPPLGHHLKHLALARLQLAPWPGGVFPTRLESAHHRLRKRRRHIDASLQHFPNCGDQLLTGRSL